MVQLDYMLLGRLYYWKGMKPHVYQYVKQCRSCQQRNKQVLKYVQGQFKAPTTPMEFISMDLIGEFQPPSQKGHRYALTVVCILTEYTFCIPLRTKPHHCYPTISKYCRDIEVCKLISLHNFVFVFLVIS